MKKINLNENLLQETSNNEYSLNPMEKYVINIKEEMKY